MIKIIGRSLMVLAVLTLIGCARDNTHIIKNYKEIIRLSDGKELVLLDHKSNINKAKQLINNTKNNKLLHMLKSVPTPMRTQPKILRIFILPWTDKNSTLHMQQYTFVVIKHGRWIMGQYLEQKNRPELRISTPLTAEDHRDK